MYDIIRNVQACIHTRRKKPRAKYKNDNVLCRKIEGKKNISYLEATK